MKTLSQLKKTISQPKGETGTSAYYPKGGDEQRFVDAHKIEVIDDANGNDDAIFKGMSVKPINRKAERHGYDHEEGVKAYDSRIKMQSMAREDVEQKSETLLDERTLTTGEMNKREDMVKGMKKNMSDFKSRYGKDAKAVMYATATKMAKEEVDQEEMDVSLLELFATLDEEEKQIMVEMIEEGVDLDTFQDLESEESNG